MSDAAVTTTQAIWRTTTLGAVTSWASGGTPSKANPDFWSGVIPWLSAKSLKSFYLHDSDDRVTEAAVADGARLALPGDVLMLVRGMTLHHDVPVGIAMRPMTFNQDVKRLRGRNGADSNFIAYWLRAHKESLLAAVDQASHGTGRLQTDLLLSMQMRLPPEEEQRRIASVLTALDDKIEQNRRTAQSLERLARAIFRAWFVDFEPVKAKAAGATAFPSMPQPVFDALPIRLVDSAIGRVPEGWKISTIGNCASYLSRGITPRYVEDVGVLVLNQKCIRDFAIDYGKARRHDSAARRIDGREVKVGDVLINSTGVGTLGRLAPVLHLPETAVVDTHVTVVRPGSEISASYFAQALISMQPHIESLGEGSTGQTELNRRKISELTLLVPATQLMDAFQDFASPLMELVSQTRLEDSRLVDLRDYLLPKLLSGKLHVEVD